MRTISRYIKRGVFLLFLLVSFVNIQGQTGNQPVKVTKRRALVGPYCMVNRISSVANVATNYSHLEYITDSDLNNYASITGIKVDALLSPVRKTHTRGERLPVSAWRRLRVEDFCRWR